MLFYFVDNCDLRVAFIVRPTYGELLKHCYFTNTTVCSKIKKNLTKLVIYTLTY